MSTDETQDIESGNEPAPDSGSREAQQLRRRLREAERERDALLERVTAFQSAEVERLAAEKLEVAGDLFAVGGIELAGLLAEDGSVDPDKVSAAADALVAERPGLANQAAARDASREALHGAMGARGTVAGGAPSWQGLFSS
ncbi:hypothetical protein GCM10012287_02860 [Streptomyces daqingensis]|uniref:Uncharacterized protein n=1 Tax=Streptomyces daqingensis TaxID=1472640 RepID=A0ABQ2LRJ2_9ACTN|nr:hypothetical protein [Streptomyces daqingensis]GGO42304.1 hypothetical protein GCM10012287_02860 [Streptomyces daqingensis]